MKMNLLIIYLFLGQVCLVSYLNAIILMFFYSGVFMVKRVRRARGHYRRQFRRDRSLAGWFLEVLLYGYFTLSSPIQ